MLLLFVSLSAFADGEGSLLVPQKMEGTEIVDKRGAKLPKDARFKNHLGQDVLLGDYLKKDGKPLIMTLGYYSCPMLCNLVMNGYHEAAMALSLHLGQDYRVLSFSINPKEDVALATAKRANYVRTLGTGNDPNGWIFHVGDEANIKRLADAVGFGFKWDARGGQYAHSAGIFVVSPEGVLSRVLYGIQYAPKDLKFALIDAASGKIGSVVDRIVMSCFHYEPDSHKYGVYVFGVMRAGAALTVLLLGIFLFANWTWERRKKQWTA